MNLSKEKFIRLLKSIETLGLKFGLSQDRIEAIKEKAKTEWESFQRERQLGKSNEV